MITLAEVSKYQGICFERGEDYVYATPHVLLRPFIQHYAVTFPIRIPNEYTVLPSASSTMIFLVEKNDNIYGGLSAVDTKASIVGNIANQAKLLLLIKFRSGGLYPFLRAEQSELRDQYLPLYDINPSLTESIEHALVCANSLDALFAELNRIFLSKYQEYDVMLKISYMKNQIISKNGNISMKELASNFFYSEKHIRRLFLNYVGTSPKSFSRIIRVNYALNLMKNPQTSLTEIAMKSGYFDQAHFDNDLKLICNITPKDYINNMSVFYKDDFHQ